MAKRSLLEQLQRCIEHAEWRKAEKLLHQAADDLLSEDERSDATEGLLMLAMTYLTIGKQEQAESLLHWGATVSERAYRPGYGRVLRALGEVQSDLGRYDVAVQTLTRAFEEHRTTLGENDRETARDVMSLAKLASAAGNAMQAASLCAEAVERLQRRVGSDSPELIDPLHAQAEILLDSDLSHEDRCLPAEEILRRIAGLQETQDPSSLDLGWTYFDLAELLQDHERCDEACDFGRQAWDLGQRHFEQDATLFEEANGWLRWWYQAHDHTDELVDLLTRALDIWREQLGFDHPKAAQAAAALGEAVARAGRLDEADQLCARAVEVFVRFFGEMPVSSELLPSTAEDLATIRIAYASPLETRASIALRRSNRRAAQLFAWRALRLLDVPADGLTDQLRSNLVSMRSEILRLLGQASETDAEAERLFQRAIAEAQASEGEALPDALDDYADWLESRGRQAEAQQTRDQADAWWNAGDDPA